MTTIKRTALVPYTQRQMFELVNDVEEYPRFLPWCHASKILKKEKDHLEASLDIKFSGIHKSIITRNQLHPYDRMEIILVHGPFKQLQGVWHFMSLGDKGCKVSVDLEFEFTGHLIDRMFQPIFKTIANSLVDAFCKRAVDIYGCE